jgi:hypothetical protein
MTEPIYDQSGRWIAPPQPVVSERPAGPWTANTPNRGDERRKGA